MTNLYQMPLSLLRQLLMRGAGAVMGFFVGVCALCLYGEIYLSASLFVIAGVLGVASAWFLYTVAAQRYVVVEGVCQRVEQTRVLRKKKATYIYAHPHTVRVELRRREADVQPGDTLRIYVTCRTPVYSVEDYKVLSGYMAMEKSERSQT